ncbi:inner membrane protein [Alkalibaculum bacchi]|uniref:Inner membrane protein n=1 Tax=Alkalibaculum bacchi TaxID=645887 RepID=A0A366I0Y0_9FIRM|nr:metal-dependent hydrolase [Alkalibaculum bacchi]RBP59324.1 inner membrane protein [Alkalibaculum bacchi]
MQYKTHVTISLAVALPIMASTNTLSIGSVAALSLGALFPDIDEPYSWIGCRTRGISDLLNVFFGHRGITHSLLGLLLTFLTLVLMVSIINFNAVTAIFFVFGYALHLIQDSFSKSGIKWLSPLSDTKFQSGKGVFYYTTGSIVENFILFVTVVCLLIEIRLLDLSMFQAPNLNILQMLGNLITKFMALF